MAIRWPSSAASFGVSRKTGYKILSRYNSCGLQGLTDRSRRPYRQANQLPAQIEALIVRLKRDKPSWGAPKIRERLARLYPDAHGPAISTVHAVLDRHCLVKHRRGRRNRAKGTPLLASPMSCGARITRASSCSLIGAIAIRLTLTSVASTSSASLRASTPTASVCSTIAAHFVWE